MKNISLRAGRFLALALLLTGLGLGSCKKDDTTTVYGNWVRNGTYSGSPRSEAVSFVINNVAYAGTGRNPTATISIFNDFYAFDPTKGGGWSPVTPMPTAAGVRYGAVAFSANSKGYVGGGYGYVGSSTTIAYLSDVWQFDPTVPTSTTVGTTTTTTVGTWTKVQSLPVSLYGAVGGSINNVGLVGCGFDGSSNRNDFYQYNATTGWSSIASPFPGDKRTGAFSFVANNQFYVAGGTNNNVGVTDVFAYNPSAGTWATKRYLRNVSNATESYDYSAVARSQAVGFSVNDKGYVVTGGSTLSTCYEYSPADDSWTLKNPFIGSVRNNAVGFGIGNYGYVGLGYTGSTRLDDFWQFSPNDAQQ